LRSQKLYVWVARTGSLAIIGGLFLYLAIRRPDVWLTSYNLMNLAEQMVCLALITIGLTITVAAGEIDLAVGSQVSLASVISMGLIVAGWPVWLAVLGALLVGVAIGLVHGVLRTVLRVPGLLPTIGTSSAVAGVALVYTWGNMLHGSGPALGAFTMMGRGRIGPFPVTATILAVLSIVFWFMLNKAKFGRVLYMIGGNPDASRLSGVPVKRYIVLAYVVCSICAAISGVLMSARIGAGNPFAGAEMLLDGLIAMNIGKTVFTEEQEPHIVGSLIGAFFMTFAAAGMQMLGKGFHVLCMLRGSLLLVSLALNSMQRRMAE